LLQLHPSSHASTGVTTAAEADAGASCASSSAAWLLPSSDSAMPAAKRPTCVEASDGAQRGVLGQRDGDCNAEGGDASGAHAGAAAPRGHAGGGADARAGGVQRARAHRAQQLRRHRRGGVAAEARRDGGDAEHAGSEARCRARQQAHQKARRQRSGAALCAPRGSERHHNEGNCAQQLW
jgi:hypothetical protein